MDLNISKYRRYTKAWNKRVSLRLKAAAPVRQADDDRSQGSSRVQEDYKAPSFVPAVRHGIGANSCTDGQIWLQN